MRYSDLTTCSFSHSPEAIESRSRRPCHVGLFVCLMPAVYHRLNLGIGHGGPSADIGLEEAAIRFPEPYDNKGDLTVHCRQWIIECVGDVAFKLMLCMCVQFGPDDFVYLDEDGEPSESPREPSGGLWI